MPSVPTPIIELVENLLAAGCNMWALGNRYMIGEPESGPAAGRVAEILTEYGPREEDGPAIVAYLRRIGRTLDDSG